MLHPWRKVPGNKLHLYYWRLCRIHCYSWFGLFLTVVFQVTIWPEFFARPVLNFSFIAAPTKRFFSAFASKSEFLAYGITGK